MDKAEIEVYLSSFKGGESSFPFGPEALVFKVMGKMYAIVSQDEEIPSVTLKVKPADGEVLESQFDSVTTGYHMNKRHWVTISLTGELTLDMIKSLCEDSYQLVVNNLTQKDKDKLKGMA
jgi:predicted DNA-binding protein (MmcQ/YjbR family)